MTQVIQEFEISIMTEEMYIDERTYSLDDVERLVDGGAHEQCMTIDETHEFTGKAFDWDVFEELFLDLDFAKKVVSQLTPIVCTL